MSGMVALRDNIREFLKKYDEITTPIFRFICSLVLFASINSMYGYSDLFEKGIVLFLLAVICALASDKVVVLLGGVMMAVNCFAISTDVGIVFLIVLVIIYCTYMRLFPNSSVILGLAVVLATIKLEFAIPVIALVIAGATGIIPAVFGVILYYFSVYAGEAYDTLHLPEEDKTFSAYGHIVDSLMDNKAIIVIGIVYAVAILISFIVYRLKINYSWYIGIGVCAALTLLVGIVCGTVIDLGDNKLNMGMVFIGVLLGLFLAAVIQFFKGIVDYSKKETVQFDDDEYYYYVTAIPKVVTKTENTDEKAQASSTPNEKVQASNMSATNAVAATRQPKPRVVQSGQSVQPRVTQSVQPRVAQNGQSRVTQSGQLRTQTEQKLQGQRPNR